MNSIWSIIGLFAVCYVLLRFVKELGESIPILEFMLAIAGLQWIIGPIIEYNTSFEHYKYFMYVDESNYMGFIVPAYIAFVLTVLKKKSIELFKSDKQKLLSQYFIKSGFLIFSIGIIAEILKNIAPLSLSFLFYILGNFKYVGTIILFYSGERKYFYFLLLAVLYLFYSSLISGLFHDFILWGVFFFITWTAKNKPTLRTKLTLILTGILLAITIQTIKSSYRLILESGKEKGGFSLFAKVVKDEIFEENQEIINSSSKLNIRLNQGWIISAILNHTPSNQPFAQGETIINAISASLLPRFLNPNKSKAGGRENFMKYTGLSLSQHTSMGMSIVGEAYVNFGRLGGIIFMGIWGVFLVWVWNFIRKICSMNMLYIFFIPLLFLQVVKAETELVVVLNHLVKSMLVVFLVFRFLITDYQEERYLENTTTN